MKSYGEFCPLALAAEVACERWTPLILRELIMGSRRFNDIHRGVPRMSPSLLSRRLKSLVAAGILERQRAGGHAEYVLTTAGREIVPVMEGLAVWGKRWLPATLSSERADPDLVMWDMHRRMALERMPGERTVICFAFSDQPPTKRWRWIVADGGAAELCITDPGFEVDLFVETDSRTITWVWYGDVPLRAALDDGRIELHGPRRLCEAFPTWLRLSVLADVPRETPLDPMEVASPSIPARRRA